MVLYVCALLLALLSWQPVDAQELRWSVRVHPAVIAGIDPDQLRLGRLSLPSLVDRLKRDAFAADVGRFLETCARKGVSEVVLDGIQPEVKGLYFRSQDLENRGWVPLVDVLRLIAEQAESRGLTVGLDLSELGIHARGLYQGEFGLEEVRAVSVPDLDPLLKEISTAYPVKTISEEDFPAAWFEPLTRLSRELGIRHVHRASADDIVSLTGEGQRTTPLEAFAEGMLLSTRDYYAILGPGVESAVTNGSLPLVLAPDRPILEISEQPEGRLFLEACLFFRAVQAPPREVTVAATTQALENPTATTVRRVQELVKLSDPALPELNLVVLGRPRRSLDPGHVAWLQLAANLEPMMLAFGAAGLRTVMTDQVRLGAAAYYIYVAGDIEEDWSRIEHALRGLPAASPVFVQFGSEPTPGLLRQVSTFFNLPEAAWIKAIIPPLGVFRGRRMSFQGIDLYQARVPTGYLQFQTRPEQRLMEDLTGRPLITRNSADGNRYFVNSNLVHRDVAFPISNLLAGGRGLQRPAVCFIAVGQRTAFWALADTEVEWIHPQSGARLVVEMRKNGFHLE
jgi:hypothetical protein